MEPATPDRPDRILNPQSAEDEAFWLPDEHHRRILEDPLVDTKVKIVAIAFAAAREGAFVRFRFQLSDRDALDHAVKLAWHAIERRGWMDALDQSLLDAKHAEPELDDRLLTQEALVSFLVWKHWAEGLAETGKIVQDFLKKPLRG
jgi:hypothetical protein